MVFVLSRMLLRTNKSTHENGNLGYNPLVGHRHVLCSQCKFHDNTTQCSQLVDSLQVIGDFVNLAKDIPYILSCTMS
jgi:hypothetical protein